MTRKKHPQSGSHKTRGTFLKVIIYMVFRETRKKPFFITVTNDDITQKSPVE